MNLRSISVSGARGNTFAPDGVLDDISQRSTDLIAWCGDVTTSDPGPASIVKWISEFVPPAAMGGTDTDMGTWRLVDLVAVRALGAAQGAVEISRWCAVRLAEGFAGHMC